MASPILIANKNSYGTLAEADDYLCGGIATTAWALKPELSRIRAMITAARIFEKQCWKGTQNTLQVIDTLAVLAGGTGYTANDLLTVQTGTGEAATIKVLTVSGGVIQTAQLVNAGLYSAAPASPVSVTGGTGGDDATFTVTFVDQPLHFPAVGVTDKDGTELSELVTPQMMKEGQFEYAFALVQSSALANKQGTGTNVKKAGAGSAAVEFFRPTGGVNGKGSQRFPAPVHELVARFLDHGRISSATVSGTGASSSFDCDDRSNRFEGYA